MTYSEVVLFISKLIPSLEGNADILLLTRALPVPSQRIPESTGCTNMPFLFLFLKKKMMCRIYFTFMYILLFSQSGTQWLKIHFPLPRFPQ